MAEQRTESTEKEGESKREGRDGKVGGKSVSARRENCNLKYILISRDREIAYNYRTQICELNIADLSRTVYYNDGADFAGTRDSAILEAI